MRELLAKRPYPYYIYAPDYRRNSSGIRVLHMLCDALIRSGYEAYVVAKVLSPEFMTPRLTDEVIQAHRAQGVEPIAVYPEIIDGNPLKLDVVVRYILNRPGFLRGGSDYGVDDIFFAYSRDLLQEAMPEDQVMLLPPFDLNVFCPPKDPSKRVKGKVCYYLGRSREHHIDPALLPSDAIEITPQWPASWEEMADLFQQCEMFYCCGSSALATEAGLCGCLTVVLVEEGAPKIGVSEAKSPGAAWGTSPDELAHARQTLSQVRDVWMKLQSDFWPALDYFIEVTQSAANERSLRSDFDKELQLWLDKRAPINDHAPLIDQLFADNNNGPKFHIVIRDRLADIESVIATIKSLDADRCFYQNFTVSVLTSLDISAEYSSVGLNFLKVNEGDAVRFLNLEVAQRSFDWMIIVEAGVEFTPAGLQVAALELLAAPMCRAVYADEISLSFEGRKELLLKPGFNLDYLLSLPQVMSRHWIYRRDVLVGNDGFDPLYSANHELELVLRLIEADGAEGIAHLDEPLLTLKEPPLRDSETERQLIERYVHRLGYDNAKVTSVAPGLNRVIYGHLDKPKVSIVIVVADELARVKRCVESVFEVTGYDSFELILVTDSRLKPETQAWLLALKDINSERLRIVHCDGEKNIMHLMNYGADFACGDYLVFIASHSHFVNSDWLEQLLNHGLRNEVGAVGAKVIFPTGQIKHAGIVLGLRGVAGGAFVGEQVDAPGYMHRLQVDQNYSALSSNCLLVRKQLFWDLQGFDDSLGEFADVDFCLRVGQSGLLLVWTPYALLVQSSLGGAIDGLNMKAASESGEVRGLLYSQWLPFLARDPAYNQNLTTGGLGFKPDYSKTREWQPVGKPLLPRILCHPSDGGGCGHYRLYQPFSSMQAALKIEGVSTQQLLSPIELERFAPDAIVYQRQYAPGSLLLREESNIYSKTFRVMDMDDYIPGVPPKSAHYKHIPRNVIDYIRKSLSLVDRFVVSTDPLAEAFAGEHPDIRVVKNKLPVDWWGGLEARRGIGRKPRVGWAGGTSHTGDLELLQDVVIELADEVEWVFFGMCPDALRPYVHEFHSGVSIERYPRQLAALSLDLALAPLEHNQFNECKSNLRLLEYGACGFPVVCTDIITYRCEMPVTFAQNTTSSWVEAIRMHLAEPDASARMGDALRDVVLRDWLLTGAALDDWKRAWLPD